MKLTRSSISPIAIAALALSTTSVAAPVSIRSEDSNCDCPAVIEVLPISTSQYNGATGAVMFQNPNQGLVFRSPTDHGADISSLVNFWIDPMYADSKYSCQVVFDLDESSTASDSDRVDIFTALAPAWANSTSWPSGNLRDHDLGRLIVTPGQRAVPDPTVQGEGFSFPCSSIAGQYYGGEVVGVDTTVQVTWTPGQDGPKIVITEQ